MRFVWGRVPLRGICCGLPSLALGIPLKLPKLVVRAAAGLATLAGEELQKRGEYARLFLECGGAKDLARGRRIHEQLRQEDSELQGDSYVGNVLIAMYCKCGSWSEAQDAFDRIPDPNLISWSSLLAAYTHDLGKCLRVFQRMLLEGVHPNKVTFVNLLKAFEKREDFPLGKLLHARVVESGYGGDEVVGTSLMNMYVKCGRVDEARKLFDSIPVESSPPWSVLIAGLITRGECVQAVRVFYQMQLQGVKPDRVTLLHAMKACSTSGPEMAGDSIRVYSCILEQEELVELRVANAALNMFGKCNSLEKTSSIFEEMVERSSCSWNTMMGACAQHSRPREAMRFFRGMLLDAGAAPDNLTFATAFSVCTDPLELERLLELMGEAGVCADVVTRTNLVNRCLQLGMLQRARDLFDGIQQRDVVLWNVMLGASWEDHDSRLKLFLEMQQEGVRPDSFSFVSLVDSLAGGSSLARRMEVLVEQIVVEAGCDSDVVVSNTLLSMKARAGRIPEAEQMFNRVRDLVSWNSMLGAFGESGEWQKALKLFSRMLLEGEKPNRISLLAAAAAAGSSESIGIARRIHEIVIESGQEQLPDVGNCLINMYSRCSSVDDSEEMFRRIQSPDVISWTALLVAYDECEEEAGASRAAGFRYRQMLQEGVLPSKVTLFTLLNMFGREAELALGRFVHSHVRELEVEADLAIASSLIGLYGQCGCREEACAVFETVPGSERDVVLYNTLISACDPTRGSSALHEMLNEGISPSKVTFISLLDAFTANPDLGNRLLLHRLLEESGFTSDAIVGNALLNLYRECGKLDECSRIFEEIGEVQSISSSWNSILAAHGQRGKVRRMMELFSRMQLHGIDANNATFVAILNGCSHAGKLELALIILQGMELDFGVVPSDGECGCIVDLLARTGRLEEAEVLVRSRSDVSEFSSEVGDQGVRFWTMLLTSCGSHGDGERGERVAQELMDLEQKMCSSGFVAITNSVRSSALLSHIKSDSLNF